jgi:type IV fimbrial biogenesis protein FimT
MSRVQYSRFDDLVPLAAVEPVQARSTVLGDATRYASLHSARQRFPAHGFTLVELLVTLAVAAVLLTMAVPGFQSVMARNRVSGLTNELIAALNLARSEAIKGGYTVTICKSTSTDATDNPSASTPTPSCSTASGVGWQNGWLVFVDNSTATGAQRGVRNTGERLLRVHQPTTTGATIDGGTNFGNYISYLSNGLSKGASLSNGSFSIVSAAEQRCVSINVTGRARLAQGACPSP